MNDEGAGVEMCNDDDEKFILEWVSFANIEMKGILV